MNNSTSELVIYAWTKYRALDGATVFRRFVVKRVYGASLDDAAAWKAANDGMDVELLHIVKTQL